MNAAPESQPTGGNTRDRAGAPSAADEGREDRRAHRWGLISNHGVALGVLARDPHVTVREVAQAVGVTERSATNLLRDLRDAGFVDVRRVGRRNVYSVNYEQQLRRDGYVESTVGELLAALHAMTDLDAEPGTGEGTAGASQSARASAVEDANAE